MDKSAPLTPAAFHILLALAGGRKHGLGIADEVEELTGGGTQLGPGTLYRSLKEMTRSRLIDEASNGDDEDPRRRYYTITSGGRAALASEAKRFDELSRLARRRGAVSTRAKS